jgi:predicted RNase H-like HicB family nuclease
MNRIRTPYVTDAGMSIENALQRVERAIERLWQLAEDEGDTSDAHQAERALQRIREVLTPCNTSGTSSEQ